MTHLNDPYDNTPLSSAESISPSPVLPPKWTNHFIAYKTHQLTLLGHICMAVGFICMIVFSEWSMLHYSSIKQQEWLPSQEMSQTEMSQRVEALQATDAEKTRMVEQLTEVFWRMNVHSKVMALFYRLNFMSLGIICFTAGLATISLFFISKYGWGNVNNAVITIFILSSGIAVLHSNLMLAMQYQDNIEVNRRLFDKYSGTKNRILSYWATQPNSADSHTVTDFIYQIDAILMESDDVPLRFDNQQISIFQESIDYFKSNTDGELGLDAIPSAP